jgi:hypothetical protein
LHPTPAKPAKPSILALIDPIAYLVIPDAHSFNPLSAVTSLGIRFENFNLENAQGVFLSINNTSIDDVEIVPSIYCACSENCLCDLRADAVFVDGPNTLEMNAL